MKTKFAIPLVVVSLLLLLYSCDALMMGQQDPYPDPAFDRLQKGYTKREVSDILGRNYTTDRYNSPNSSYQKGNKNKETLYWNSPYREVIYVLTFKKDRLTKKEKTFINNSNNSGNRPGQGGGWQQSPR